MTFSEVLPHLEAGRVITRIGFKYRWRPNRLEMFLMGSKTWAPTEDASHLTASDWEVAEEPRTIAQCCFKAREYTCDKQAGHSGWHSDDTVCFCPVGAESGEIPGMHQLRMDVARLERELAEARSPCMCVSSSVHARCAMPGGHPGKIHTDGSYVWLV